MNVLLDYLIVYLVGGAICIIAQILIDKTKLTPARILVTYVCTGVFLSAIGVYKPFADFAGAGATVPLTGFGHMLFQGVKEGIRENGILGVLTGPLTAASTNPVLLRTDSPPFPTGRMPWPDSWRHSKSCFRCQCRREQLPLTNHSLSTETVTAHSLTAGGLIL
jgi:stage V sporulation protein AE